MRVSPVPGASALLAALVASGLDVDRFTFFGFLARKGTRAARQRSDEIVALAHTAVLYEAPSRVADTLAELADAGAGERAAAVARELTKQFEELRRGTVAELAAYYGDTPPRGEVVIVIAGRSPRATSEDELRARAAELRAAGRSARDVAAALVGRARRAAQRGVPPGARMSDVRTLEVLRAVALRRGSGACRRRRPAAPRAARSPSRACSTTAAATGTPTRRASRTCSRRSASARRCPVERTEARVTLTDDQLWDYPFLHMTGHGNIKLTDAEVVRLREYLQRGGFLHADDNYGLDESFRREMARVFPDRPLVDVPLSHPIYHAVYDFPKGLPKIHEHDGKPPRGFGIFLGDRLAVFYSYASDLGNGWEDPETYKDPAALHEAALRMGVNLFVYAVTSRPLP